MNILKNIGYILFFSLMFYISVAYVIWGIRHPKANEFTFYINFIEVMTFQEVDEYK